MPDYKELFYQSQAALADAVDALRKLTLQLESEMRRAEEEVLSQEENPDIPQ